MVSPSNDLAGYVKSHFHGAMGIASVEPVMEQGRIKEYIVTLDNSPNPKQRFQIILTPDDIQHYKDLDPEGMMPHEREQFAFIQNVLAAIP